MSALRTFIPWLLTSLVVSVVGCSSGGAGNGMGPGTGGSEVPIGLPDLAETRTDLRMELPDLATPSDLQSPEGLSALPDGTYVILATTTRLEHVSSGEPNRCPYWSDLFTVSKTGSSIKLTGSSVHGYVRDTPATVDEKTGKLDGKLLGSVNVEVSGTLRYAGGKLVLDSLYRITAPWGSLYPWKGELAEPTVFGSSTVPPGARRTRLTWTDTNNRPQLIDVDILLDAAGRHWVSLPRFLGSAVLPFDSGRATYTPPWDVCAGPSALLIKYMKDIQISALGVITHTTLPDWYL